MSGICTLRFVPLVVQQIVFYLLAKQTVLLLVLCWNNQPWNVQMSFYLSPPFWQVLSTERIRVNSLWRPPGNQRCTELSAAASAGSFSVHCLGLWSVVSWRAWSLGLDLLAISRAGSNFSVRNYRGAWRSCEYLFPEMEPFQDSD